MNPENWDFTCIEWGEYERSGSLLKRRRLRAPGRVPAASRGFSIPQVLAAWKQDGLWHVNFGGIRPGSGNWSWGEVTSRRPPGRISRQILGLALGPWRCLILLPGGAGLGGGVAFGEQRRRGDHGDWGSESSGKRWALLRVWRGEGGASGLQVHCCCLSDHSCGKGRFLHFRGGGAAPGAPWEPRFLIASFSFSRFAFFFFFASPKAYRVPRPGIRSTSQLRPMPHWILNLLRQVRDWTCVPAVQRRHWSHCPTVGIPRFAF